MALLKHRLHRFTKAIISQRTDPDFFGTSIKGSTLVETLVAMIIVMLAFGIGLMIYLNVIQSSGAQQKLNAQLQINKIAIETKDKNLFADDEYAIENLKIVKTVQAYSSESDKLKLLKIEAFDGNGKKISERKELVITE